MMSSPKIERALVSVSDKAQLVELGRGLAAAGVEIYASGGSRRHLEEAGIAVREVAAYTGFPEMMDGRIKTLHPKIHGGILCRRDRPEDMAAAAEQGIVPFELVVVNLYPFAATIARGNVSVEEAIEQIDIGGPTLIRAAAKNHAFVTVAVEPAQYERILEQIKRTGATTPELRRELAGAAFAHTAEYDRVVDGYFAGLAAKAQAAGGAVAAVRASFRSGFRSRSSGRRRCGMARIRIRRRPCMRRRMRRLARSFVRSNCTARNCRTTIFWIWIARSRWCGRCRRRAWR